MKLWIIALLALIFVAACAPEDTVNLGDPFIGGIQGLELYFLDGLPPDAIQDNGESTFGVGVSVSNVGEADVDYNDGAYAVVKLEGILPEQFGVTDDDIETSFEDEGIILNGAKKNFDGTIIPGMIDTVVFGDLNYLPDLRGNSQQTLRAVACYDYQSYSSTQICVKESPLENIQDESICTITGEKGPKNSGAPLAITSLIQNPLSSNSIQVNFVVEHLGYGDFFGQEDGENCDFTVTNTNKYNVDINVAFAGDAQGRTIDCPRLGGTDSGTVRMYNGAPTTITCTLEMPDGNRVYTDVLDVQLSYRYGQFIEVPLIIQDVSG